MAEAPAPQGRKRSLWSRPRRTRLYSSDRAAPRARRATDLGLAAGAVLGIVVVSQGSQPPSGFEQALITLAASIPPFLEIVWRVLAVAPVGWGVCLVAASLIRWRPDILRDVVLAAATGFTPAKAAPRPKDLATLNPSIPAIHLPPSVPVPTRRAEHEQEAHDRERLRPADQATNDQRSRQIAHSGWSMPSPSPVPAIKPSPITGDFKFSMPCS